MTGHESNGKDRGKPLLIENVYEKETTESFIERHFRERFLHRCRGTAEYDVDAIARDFGQELVRSSQDLEPNKEGKGMGPQWSMLLFKKGPHMFWHFVIKANNAYGASDESRVYTLTVTSDSAPQAAQAALMLHEKYTIDEDAPGFVMVQNAKSTKRIPLQPAYFLSSRMLTLHYGPGFDQWAAEFAAGLMQNGLSILRGKPGTGKTSFLRHLIYSLAESHRFYYVPVDSFGLLQNHMTDFLIKERKRFDGKVLVIVLEDAEQLLASRRGGRDMLTSSLLNFTDGFIGDMAQAHLICTMNGNLKDLDEAVLRPGRQRFFREFLPLDWPQAQALAAELGVSLVEERSYSLAELYHFKDASKPDRLGKNETPAIGFPKF